MEAEFWKAYQSLVQATYPITAESIRESEFAIASKWTGTTGLAILAAATFAIFVLLLASWVIGTNLLKDFEKSETSIASAAEERRKLELKRVTTVLAENERATGQEGNRQLETQIPRKMPEDVGLSLEIEAAEQKLNVMRTSRSSLGDLLSVWYSNMTLGRSKLKADDRLNELVKTSKILEDEYSKCLAPGEGEKLTIAFTRCSQARAKLYNAQTQISNMELRSINELRARAQLVLSLLERYLLPICLGLLGALTFILRSRIAQVRSFTYTRNFSSLSFVRISLGVIAGLLGGLFMSTDNPVLKDLPALALPFLFGYAVEVLFSFLDRIVKAFVDEGKTTH
jgi:hypothetical protein